MVFAPLIKLNIPPLTKMTLKTLIKIATFDVLQTDDWFPEAFDFPESEPLNERFGDYEFETMIVIMNLGTLWLVGLFCALMYLLHFALYRF
jgi:hypothetical protein